MRLSSALVPGLALVLTAVAGLADRALVGRAEVQRANAALRIDEDARLAATSVETALSRHEQAAAAGSPERGVRVERLAAVPSRAVPAPGFTPYASRSRSELVALLSSRRTTHNGLPEAVVARLALGPAAPVSGADAASVEDRLLSGDLPVRPDDLAFLVGALGLAEEGRARDLEARLRRAPPSAELPPAPKFARRVREGGRIEGWTRLAEEATLRYELPVSLLLAALPSERGRLRPDTGASPGLSRVVPVPGLEGLRLRYEPRLDTGVRLTALRAVLWIAAGLGVLAAFGLARARTREARALARERAFLAAITHELRTPLTALRALGETLAGGRGEPREYGTLVAGETERLEKLVEQVLTAARIDHAPRFRPVDAGTLIRSAVDVVKARARRRGAQLDVSLDGDLPECRWDADAVRRALLNLLDNAIVHGRRGGRVEVRGRREETAVRLEVRDDGPGIGGPDRRRIFHRFERGPTEAPGTGLGLYLVDVVVRSHGGRVDLVTSEGRGAAFSLLLPIDPPELPAVAPEP